MFRGWRCILIVFVLLMIGVGAASALTTVTVERCGYAAKGFYGKDAIYPLHMSCAQARTILAGAINPHAKHINLTADGAATGDAGPVLIDGRRAHLSEHEPVLVASGVSSFTGSGTMKVTIRLSRRGKTLLKRHHRPRLAVRAAFTATGRTALVFTKTFVLQPYQPSFGEPSSP